eukprot:c15756_g1_i2 orf=169-564(-)
MLNLKNSCGCCLILLLLIIRRAEGRPRFIGRSSFAPDCRQISTDSPYDTKRITNESRRIQEFGSRIGSRPPSCVNKCNACFPCEAVQVPTPANNRKARAHFPSSASRMHVNYSNYQPEGWKCKCGNAFFNP